jgi:hypothetical protein
VTIACGPDSPDSIPTHLLGSLERHPGKIPNAAAKGTPVVMLTLGMDDRGVQIDGAPMPVLSSLKFERAMAERRTELPEYWVLQTREDGLAYHYWTPVDPSPEIRVDLPRDADDQDSSMLLKLPEMYVMLRLPFYPGGRVDFYSHDGKAVSRFRFGPQASAPLESVEP